MKVSEKSYEKLFLLFILFLALFFSNNVIREGFLVHNIKIVSKAGFPKSFAYKHRFQQWDQVHVNVSQVYGAINFLDFRVNVYVNNQILGTSIN